MLVARHRELAALLEQLERTATDRRVSTALKLSSRVALTRHALQGAELRSERDTSA